MIQLFENITPLPLQNSFVSLLSTGLDSPIASYLIMRQGYNCYTLSFLNGKKNLEVNRLEIIKTGQKLKDLTHKNLRMHFVDYDAILEQFQSRYESKMTCILCKRTMMQTAVKLAEFYQAQFIVNGDILGEQASQTLDNLYVVNQINHSVPVIRPLIGFDKLDIIKISQKLGFYDISLMPTISCIYNPKFPETRAKLSDILTIEQNLDRLELLTQIFKSIKYIDLID